MTFMSIITNMIGIYPDLKDLYTKKIFGSI